MSAVEPSDYLPLAKLGRKLPPNENAFPVVRLAMLSDNSTQQLSNVLKASFWNEKFYPEIYEGEIDSIATEVLNDNSSLHQFQPQYVWLNLSSQNYRDRFYFARGKEKEALPANYAGEVLSLVDALLQKGYYVILNSLSFPQERFFGNYSAQTLYSLYASITEVNHLLVAKVKNTSQCFLNDLAFLAMKIGLDRWYDERLWAHSKYMCAPQHFPVIARSVVDLVKTTRGRVAKCLVLDLDNTLWGGIVGDDAMDGIELGGIGGGESFARFQRYLLHLKERGFVLAVCSKNNPEVALAAFRQHSGMILREQDVAVFVANWNAKSANIEHIAKVLNLGLDSMVFIDDSPFERNEVRQALPAVIVPEMPEDVAQFPAFLESLGLFETLAFSEDDRKRAQMYREEAQRTTLQISVKSIDEYLQSLEMKIVCQRFDAQHLPRIAQLLQRSNQFNLRTQRFSEGRCQEVMNDFDRSPSFYVKLKDRFGDYGLISVVCTEIKEKRLDILEYVMSCRVLNRGVEQYVMTSLVNLCKERGLATICGEFIPTEKNKMVVKFFEQFGFQQIEERNGKTTWELVVADYRAPKCFIQPEEIL
jgi:FkbH-like protein